MTPEQIRIRFQTHGHRGAIVGPEGSGKSTLLRELEERLDAAGLRTRLVRFDDAAKLLRVDPRTVLMIDGAEMLPRIVQAGLALIHRRLVVTAHRAYPGLPLLLRAQASRHTLDELILELVGPDGPCRKSANALFSGMRGNIRAVLAALYDDFACDRLATAGIEERKRP